MKKTSKILLSFFLLGLIVSSGLWAAGKKETAANYPTKPVTIIVASKAGGGTDTMARLFAKYAKKYFPQPFVVVDKPGAGGQLGFEALAKAKPDGYTIGTLFTPHVTAHISSGRAKYTLDSFRLLVNVVTDPGVLVVKADSPFKTINDIIAAEKKKPGSLTGATTGPGGDDFFALTKFNTAAGIHIKEVPAKGSAGEKTEVLGGHVDMAFMNVSQVESNVKAGELRMLAVMTDKRLPYLPNIPTFKELGINIVSDSSRGFAAPAGIPDAIYNKLLDTFKKTLNDPDFRKAAKGVLLLNIMWPKEYRAYLEGLLKTTNEIYAKSPW